MDNAVPVFDTAVGTLPQALAIVDASGHVIYANQSWLSLADLNDAPMANVRPGVNCLEVGGAPETETVPDSSAFREAIRAALEGKAGPFELEYPCSTDDRERWFLGRVTAFESLDAHYALIVHEEITERKHLAESLSELQTRYHLLADNSMDGVWIMSLDLVFRFVHPTVPQGLGYSSEEWRGTQLSEYCDETNYALMMDAVKKAFSLLPDTPTITIEAQMISKQGDPVWVEVRGRIIRDEAGNPIGIQGITRNINDRKLAELQAGRFKTVFDKANFGIILMDLDGTIGYANAAFAELHGYSPSEISGKHVALFHNEQQMEMVAEAKKRMQQEDGFNALEIWHKHKDGREFPMLMNGMLLRDAAGAPMFMALTGIDISDRVQSAPS